MYCFKCGTEVKEKFCPNCGTEVGKNESNNDIAMLKITRPDDFLGSMFSAAIYVDDKSFSFKNGETMNICLTPGLHVIKYNMVGVTEKKIEIMAEVGKNYSLEFDFELLNGYVVSKRSVLK